jgi:hypothetical protein
MGGEEAEGRGQKAEVKRQKAEGRGQTAELFSYKIKTRFCVSR